MKFDRVFRLLIVGVAALGFLSLLLTGSVGWLGTLAMVFGLVGPLLLGKRPGLSSTGWNILTVIMLGWTAALFFVFSFNSLDSARDLLIYLQINRLLQKRTNRDVLYICLLAFSQILLSSLLTISPWFALILVAFLVLTSWLLVLLQLKIGVDLFAEGTLEGEDGGVTAAAETSGSGSAVQLSFWRRDFESDPPDATRRVRVTLYQEIARIFTKSWVLASLALLTSILVLTVALFMLIPRLELGVLQGEVGSPIHVAGFSEQVRLGDVGSILKSNGRVMRVRLEGDVDSLSLPLYWRGMALDQFDGRSWSLSLKQKRAFPQRRGTRWDNTSAPEGVVAQHVTLEPIDTGILFVLPEVISIDIGRSTAFQNGTGSLLSDMGLQRLTYSVYSRVPRKDRIVGPPPGDDVLFQSKSPEGLIDSNRSAYLQLPAFSPAVRQLARDWTKRAQSPRARAEAIETALRTQYGYTLDLKSTGPSPLEDFLLRTREGHCEYFASALVILARHVGIPSRLVNGFMGGELNRVGNYWVIRQKDAHAWAELWFEGEGWVRMDATPAGVGGPEPGPMGRWMASMAQYVDWFETRWYFYILEYDLRSQLSLLSELIVKFPRVASSSVYERGGHGIALESVEEDVLWLVLAMLAIGGVLLWRRRQAAAASDKAPQLSPAGRAFFLVYERIHARLKDLGMVRQAGETPLELARRIDRAFFGAQSAASPTPEDDVDTDTNLGPVGKLEAIAYRLRYGAAAGTEADLLIAQQLYANVRELPVKTRQ